MSNTSNRRPDSMAANHQSTAGTEPVKPAGGSAPEELIENEEGERDHDDLPAEDEIPD